jgi:FK506-binding protein 4/5
MIKNKFRLKAKILLQLKTGVNISINFVSFFQRSISFVLKGLLKEIVREGSDEEKPWFDDKVSIHYTGTLLDGTVFNTSRNQDEKFSFNLGRGEVIKAWDMGVATMKRGEIARFFSKPKYAYGLKGLPGKVESATSVIFEIELVDCIGKSKY